MVVSGGWYLRTCYRYCVHHHPSVIRSRGGNSVESSSGGEVWLKYLEGKTTVWWAILGLCVFTDFLFVPVALSLYVALERVNRNAMLVATAFVGLFVVLDMAVTWTNYASLLTLSGLPPAHTTDDRG